MLQNYLTVALRNIGKHKLYSFINIAGLAVALACAILIMLFVRDELSYDRATPSAENIYRGEVSFYPPGRDPLDLGSSMYPLASALREEVSGVVETLRISGQNSAVKYEDKSFFEPIMVAEPNFFTMTGYKLLKGDPATILARPDTMVVTETFAKKYFGNDDPIGKVLTLDAEKAVEIVGVMADLPHNVHLKVNAVLPLGSKADRVYGVDPQSHAQHESWTNANFYTYARLAPGTDIAAVERQLPDMIRRHVKGSDLGFAPDADMSQLIRLRLRPYTELHFANTGGIGPNFTTTPGDKTAVYGFTLIAALIIVIAAINFMNLATARATQRAREVGMRKVVGAKRRQLVIQFLGESVLISLFALALSLALVELLLPSFGRFVDRPISLSYLADWDVTTGALVLAILTGLLGGIYPALVLSGFRPAVVLKSNKSGQSGSGMLRATLVVMQFAISIALGITAAVVYGQTIYAQSFDVGFTRDNMLVLTGIGRDQVEPVRETIRNELLALPAVKGVAGASDTAFGGNENNTVVRTPENPTEVILLRQLTTEPEFFDTYGIKLLAGRGFSRDRGEDVDTTEGPVSAPDGLSIIINEAAVKRLGYSSPQEAIGKVLREDGIAQNPAEAGKQYTRVIIGVVPDFHFDGLRSAIQPTRYVYAVNALNHFTIAVRGGSDVRGTMDAVRDIWARHVPDLPIRLAFLDESYQKLYEQDEKRGQMFALFTLFAILIACLGLFGLASFTAERRTKEIGVRKVFGARVRDIVGLLLWQFSKPVLIANLIAWPLAWYYLSDWLSGFAYRIELNPLYFAGAGLAALLIAWATVTMHSVRVARSKPVHALRYE